jgi:hypothetical protein
MSARRADAAAAPIEISVVMMMVMVVVTMHPDAHAGHPNDRPVVVVMVVVVPPVAVVVMVMPPARDLHLAGLSRDILLARRLRGGIGCLQRRDGVRNRIEQLGKRVGALGLRRRGGRSSLRGRVERRQPGDGADGADQFLVHENFPSGSIRSRSAHGSPHGRLRSSRTEKRR